MYVKSAPSLISFSFIAILAASGAAAQNQGNSAQAPAPANGQARVSSASDESQTDIGGSFYRAMNSATTAKGVTQSPVDADGGMLEIRHIHSPLIGYEVTYGYNREDETVAAEAAPACETYDTCSTPTQKMTASTSLVGLDWVFSKKFGNLRPFATAGLGFFIDEPTSPRIQQTPTTSVPGYGVNDTVRISYLYGGGVDWSITRHLGIRGQYRGVVYRVPNISMLFPAQGLFTQTSEPMGGIFYRF
jgi:opacity protein-like surface antigen